MQHINQQPKYLNGGKVVIYNENKKLLNKRNYGIVKSIEYTQKAAALISEMILIMRQSIIKYEF